PDVRPFSLQFGRLSPYAVMEILEMSDAQQERFLKAYDVGKQLLRDLGVFPRKGNPTEERIAAEVDEFERGCPRMSLPLILDIVAVGREGADRPPANGRQYGVEDEADNWNPSYSLLRAPAARQKLYDRIAAANMAGNVSSWRALFGKLYRLQRLGFFDIDK